jgi:hypothetical protein
VREGTIKTLQLPVKGFGIGGEVQPKFVAFERRSVQNAFEMRRVRIIFQVTSIRIAPKWAHSGVPPYNA